MSHLVSYKKWRLLESSNDTTTTISVDFTELVAQLKEINEYIDQNLEAEAREFFSKYEGISATYERKGNILEIEPKVAIEDYDSSLFTEIGLFDRAVAKVPAITIYKGSLFLITSLNRFPNVRSRDLHYSIDFPPGADSPSIDEIKEKMIDGLDYRLLTKDHNQPTILFGDILKTPSQEEMEKLIFSFSDLADPRKFSNAIGIGIYRSIIEKKVLPLVVFSKMTVNVDEYEAKTLARLNDLTQVIENFDKLSKKDQQEVYIDLLVLVKQIQLDLLNGNKFLQERVSADLIKRVRALFLQLRRTLSNEEHAALLQRAVDRATAY